MKKLAHTQVTEILQHGSATIRALSEENQVLREKVASFELDARCRNIAQMMADRHLHPELSEEEKIAALKQRASKLDTIEEAVGMTANQGIELGSLEDPGKAPDGTGSSLFEAFLLS